MNAERRAEIKQRAEAIASTGAGVLTGELDVTEAVQVMVTNAERIAEEVARAEGEQQLNERHP